MRLPALIPDLCEDSERDLSVEEAVSGREAPPRRAPCRGAYRALAMLLDVYGRFMPTESTGYGNVSIRKPKEEL